MKLFKVILVNVLGIPLALLFLILSAVSFSDASSGPKGMEIIHGVFRTQSDAVDPTASLTGRGALIIRSARILHYQLESVNDDNSTAYRVETVWDEGDRDSFTLDGKEYRNPPLPGELRRNVYFGTAVLGEESIRLSDAMLYELKRAPQDHVGNAVIAPTDLPDDLLEKYDLVQDTPGHFVSKHLKPDQVGFIEVC